MILKTIGNIFGRYKLSPWWRVFLHFVVCLWQRAGSVYVSCIVKNLWTKVRGILGMIVHDKKVIIGFTPLNLDVRIFALLDCVLLIRMDLIFIFHEPLRIIKYIVLLKIVCCCQILYRVQSYLTWLIYMEQTCLLRAPLVLYNSNRTACHMGLMVGAGWVWISLHQCGWQYLLCVRLRYLNVYKW